METREERAPHKYLIAVLVALPLVQSLKRHKPEGQGLSVVTGRAQRNGSNECAETLGVALW